MQPMHFIGNAWVAGQSGKVIDCVNPSTGEVFEKTPAGGQAEIDVAVNAARTAFIGGWKNTTGTERAARPRTITAGITANRRTLAALGTPDNGKPLADAPDAGITWQNGKNMAVIQAPRGGMRNSGIGRELGLRGLESLLEPRQKTRWLPGGGVDWYAMPAEATE